MRLPNLLATRRGRLAAFFLLYITEGIPLGFAATAIATQLRRQDVGPAEIGAFVGSFYLPWAFKWAFGPFIDTFTSERLGRRRGWIIFTQVLMAVTLMSTVLLKLPEQLALFTLVLLIHNSFGAMQDVAIDALAVNTLAEQERGLANGLMFAGAGIGQAVGGAGVLFLAGYTGFTPTFFFVAACILSVTLFVVLPMREPPGEPRPAGTGEPRWRTATREMGAFAMASFRAFLETRGAFMALAFALLPAGAMCLGLALQNNLSVELGLNDNQVAAMSLWSNVISSAFMVLGGWLSDRWGRRLTLSVFIAMMSLPVIYLMLELQRHGWVMPVPQTGASRTAVPDVLVLALWIATLAYAVPQGLMYGTRTALYMDVTNPKVAATQFTAYMALLNLSIAYSSTWQGVTIEAFGYPTTMAIDAVTGVLCLLVIPFIRNVRGNAPDGGAPGRARIAAALLGVLCLAWLPIRMNPQALGAGVPVVDTLYTVVFVASALFLLAGGSVLRASAGALARAALVMAPLLFLIYARRWIPALGADMKVFAEWAVRAIPLLAALMLLAMAARPWKELANRDEAPLQGAASAAAD